ncbi:hypothetical protein ABPG74_020634 [Tetrahymena malaccensis]
MNMISSNILLLIILFFKLYLVFAKDFEYCLQVQEFMKEKFEFSKQNLELQASSEQFQGIIDIYLEILKQRGPLQSKNWGTKIYFLDQNKICSNQNLDLNFIRDILNNQKQQINYLSEVIIIQHSQSEQIHIFFIEWNLQKKLKLDLIIFNNNNLISSQVFSQIFESQFVNTLNPKNQEHIKQIRYLESKITEQFVLDIQNKIQFYRMLPSTGDPASDGESSGSGANTGGTKPPSNTCPPCPGTNCISNCAQCLTNNQNIICTTCITNFALVSSISCSTCGSGQYFQTSTQPCGSCPSNCQVCSSSSICSVCNANYQLDSTNNCQICQINNGQYYDSSSKQCVNCFQNCLQCTNQNSCQICASGYYPNNNQCSKCYSSCLSCNGPNSNNCLSCNSGYYFYTSNSTCQQTCNTAGGFFVNQDKCTPCDQTCSTCNGPSNSQCIACISGLYKYGGDNLCKTCPTPTTSVQTTISNCKNSSNQCIYNNQTQSYELTGVCLVCNSGYSLINGVCIDSCSLISPNYYLNTSTNECQCSFDHPYKHIRRDNSVFCSSQQQLGYFCLSNKICNECFQLNCQICQDQNTCTLCNSGNYLWLNQCVQQCPASKNLQISSSNTLCECIQGYILIIPDNICVVKLAITQINLSKESLYNTLTIIFNRVPYPSEITGMSIQLDPGKLILNKDYQIVQQQQVSNTIVFTISVEQNRRVNQIVVSYKNQQEVFQIQNAILTTNNYNNSQQNIQDKIDSATNASQVLVSSKGNGYVVILILKQFQVLCFFSNFIQFFGPLILFKQYLPQTVYVSTILASSFIFNSIPDAYKLNVSIQSDSSSQNSVSSEQQLLQDLGLQENLYSALPIPNISLIITVIIVVLCCFARWIMKGKQYTMEIVNFLINIASSTQQGFITPSLFSIYYCLSYTQGKYYAIIQLIIHAAFFVLIYCFSFKKDNKFSTKFSGFYNQQLGKRLLGSCVVQCQDCKAINCALGLCNQGYYFNNNKQNPQCISCDKSCLECNGPQNNQCTSCPDKFQFQNGQCIQCQLNNGEYFDQNQRICQPCLANCQTCSNNNTCDICESGFQLIGNGCLPSCQNNQFRDKNYICQNCASTCLTCVDTATTCTSCQNDLYLNTQSSSCQKCDQPGFFIQKDKCIPCDSTCLTCINTAITCTSCQNNQYLNTQSSSCQIQCNQQGFFIQQNNCIPCDHSCLSCAGTSKFCTQCQPHQFLNTISSTCLSSCPVDGFYVSGQACMPCHPSCATCSGPLQTDCNSCVLNLFQYGDDKSCRACPNSSIDPSIIAQKMQNCAQIVQNCQLNSLTNKYELTGMCGQCQSSYVLSNNSCIKSCQDVALDYAYKQALGYCQCIPSSPYQHNQSNGKLLCNSFQLSGYYCDSNKICNPCQQSNCQTCTNQQVCQVCNQGYYLWQNQCVSSCESNLGLDISQSNKECICKPNYIFYPSKQICVLQLQINSIKLTKDSQYNIITVIFNRAPFSDELQTINLKIDPSKLIQNTDYTIVSQQQNDKSLIFQVSVPTNIKITQIIINYNNKSATYKVENTILTSEQTNHQLQSNQGTINNMNSLGQSLSPQGGSAQTIINILKNFQILCLLSNFVQLLGPLILFKDYLPQPLYVGALLGASFIFTEIPDSDELSASLIDSQNNSLEISNKQSLLEGLGFSGNIYQNLPIPHLLLIVSVVLSLLCLFARWVMKGKQYTMTVQIIRKYFEEKRNKKTPRQELDCLLDEMFTQKKQNLELPVIKIKFGSSFINKTNYSDSSVINKIHNHSFKEQII